MRQGIFSALARNAKTERKWNAGGPHPYDAEAKSKELVPMDHQRQKERMNYYFHQGPRGIPDTSLSRNGYWPERSGQGDNALMIEEQAREYGRMAARLQAEIDEGTADREFVRRFQLWMLGKGDQRDHSRTPWEREPLRFNDIQEYLDTYVTLKYDFDGKLTKLRQHGPRNLKEAWYYYKFIIRGENGKAEERLDFMKDFGGPDVAAQTQKDEGPEGSSDQFIPRARGNPWPVNNPPNMDMTGTLSYNRGNHDEDRVQSGIERTTAATSSGNRGDGRVAQGVQRQQARRRQQPQQQPQQQAESSAQTPAVDDDDAMRDDDDAMRDDDDAMRDDDEPPPPPRQPRKGKGKAKAKRKPAQPKTDPLVPNEFLHAIHKSQHDQFEQLAKHHSKIKHPHEKHFNEGGRHHQTHHAITTTEPDIGQEHLKKIESLKQQLNTSHETMKRGLHKHKQAFIKNANEELLSLFPGPDAHKENLRAIGAHYINQMNGVLSVHTTNAQNWTELIDSLTEGRQKMFEDARKSYREHIGHHYKRAHEAALGEHNQEKAELKNQIEVNTKDMGGTREENKRLKNRVNALLEEGRRLEDTSAAQQEQNLERLRTLEKEAAESKRQRDEIQQQLQDTKAQADQRIADVRGETSATANILRKNKEEEVANLNERIRQKDEEISALRANDNQRQQTMDNQLQDLRNAHDDATRQLQRAREALREQTTHRNSLAEQLGKMSTEKELEASRKEGQAIRANELQAELEEVRQKSGEALRNQTQVIERLEGQKKESSNQITELQRNVTSLTQQLSQAQHDVRSLAAQKSDTEGAHDRASQQRDEAQREVQRLKNELQRKREDLKVAAQAHNTQVNKYSENVQALEAKVADQKQALYSAEAAHNSIRQQLQEKDEELKALKAQRDKLNALVEQQGVAAGKTREMRDADRLDYEAQIGDLQRDKSRLQEQADEFQQSIRRLEEKQAKSASRAAALSETMEVTGKQLPPATRGDPITAAMDEFTAKYDKAQSNAARLNAELSAMAPGDQGFTSKALNYIDVLDSLRVEANRKHNFIDAAVRDMEDTAKTKTKRYEAYRRVQDYMEDLEDNLQESIAGNYRKIEKALQTQGDQLKSSRHLQIFMNSVHKMMNLGTLFIDTMANDEEDIEDRQRATERAKEIGKQLRESTRQALNKAKEGTDADRKLASTLREQYLKFLDEYESNLLQETDGAPVAQSSGGSMLDDR